MKKLGDIFTKYKNVVIFTLAYVAILSTILYLLFGFKTFSIHHWNILFSIRLHGFAGFVLMALVICSIPFLIAAAKVILKTGKPLIKIFPDKKKPDDKKVEKKEDEKTADTEPTKNIPTELRGAFLRAQSGNHHILRGSNTVIVPETVVAPDEFSTTNLPLPDDFDLEASDSVSVPMFREINFDQSPTSDDFEISGDRIIAIHDDSDFWIADNDEWFANGKQKPSPIKELLRAANDKNLKPVLELRATNIMDIDAKIKEWESMGIEVKS